MFEWVKTYNLPILYPKLWHDEETATEQKLETFTYVPCVIHLYSVGAQQKWDGYFNLAKVISVTAESHHVTPTLSFYFSYTLETECIHANV